ncbi:MAG TPA: hypothetical protein VGG62_17225 [Terracidiphilus sp.]
MTFPCIRILALVVIAGLPLAAQQQPSSPPTQPSTAPEPANPQASNPGSGSSVGSNPKAEPAPSTADSPEIANPALRPVTGELENKLDTKDAKNGDPVVIKTTGTAATADGIEIPKGSRIVGHVIDVAAKGAGGDNSRVTIQFDQAEIKGGQRLPILSVIQAVEPAGSGGAPESAQGGAPATASGPAGQSGTGQAGTGQAGTGQATGNDTSAGGTQTSPSAQSTPGALPPVGTVVARKGNIAIKTTAIPGVLLVGNANGQPFSNASGALLGAQQDVQLNDGTVMVVAIAMMPPRPNAH